jgi:hypothetical protein
MLRMLRDIAADEDTPPAVRLAAIRDWLDRAGIDRKIEIEVSSPAFEAMIMGSIAQVEEGTAILGPDYNRRINGTGDVIEGEVIHDETYEPDETRHTSQTRRRVKAINLPLRLCPLSPRCPCGK